MKKHDLRITADGYTDAGPSYELVAQTEKGKEFTRQQWGIECGCPPGWRGEWSEFIGRDLAADIMAAALRAGLTVKE
jgi:hypothetical protein